MTRRTIVVAALALGALGVLGACGRKGTLHPLPGQSPPPLPYGAAAPPTVEQALTPPPDAGPARVDDVIKRPEQERRDDPFDLPPPGALR